MNAAVKVAKIEAQTQQLRMAKELTLAILDNAAFDLVAGTLAIEYFAKADQGDLLYEWLQGAGKTVLEAGLIVVCTAKALSPVINSPAAENLIGKFLK